MLRQCKQLDQTRFLLPKTEYCLLILMWNANKKQKGQMCCLPAFVCRCTQDHKQCEEMKIFDGCLCWRYKQYRNMVKWQISEVVCYFCLFGKCKLNILCGKMHSLLILFLCECKQDEIRVDVLTVWIFVPKLFTCTV